MPKPKKSDLAIIYARFSPRKNAAECESCEAQISYCTKYCEFHGIEIIGVFRDDGLSGSCARNRPGLQKAMAMAIANKGLLVFYSLSRLARNTKETIEISEKLHKYHANFCSVTEKIDTSTAMGDAFFKILAVLAELERKQISERTSSAMIFHQRNGRRMSHRLQFGQKKDPNDSSRTIPDDRELAIIAQIKNMRSQGLSSMKIANKLTSMGIEPRNGKWHKSLVRNIIKRLDVI